jgi:Zn-dependent M28 family amino/carboxypeptidase
MNKNTIAILLVCLVGFHLYGVMNRENIISPEILDQPQVVETTNQTIIDSIKSEDVKKYVEDLSSKEFDGRGTGTEGNKKAAEYIKNHLDKLNIKYVEQEFNAAGKTTKNIIAYIEPKNKSNDNIIVIGAHFDHLGSRGGSYYPGADDNASGVAGLMSIATALSKYKDKLKNTVSLQFYSGEELGLIGSKFYTNNPILPISKPNINNHIAMINLDMIGYLKNNYSESENTTSYKDYKERIVFDYSNMLSLKDTINSLLAKYPFAKNISGYKPGGSDHAPFYNKGIPIVFLHTGIHQHYHRISDTPEKLNYQGLCLVAKLALEVLLQIDI